jgi:translation initiation factor 1A
MPNKKGGKGYKKGKGDEVALEFIDIQEGQYMARAIRLLGSRNVLCYCDDNVLRICHISRNMKRGRVWVETGDVVLISLRHFSDVDTKTIKRGDIIAKYAPEQLRLLKKEGKVNERLFMKLEDRGVMIEAVGEDMTDETMIVDAKEDDLFDYDDEDDEASGSEEKDEPTIVAKKDKVNHRVGRVEREISLDDL